MGSIGAIGRIARRVSKGGDLPHSGTRSGRPLFVRSPGIDHTRLSESNCSGRANLTSFVRVAEDEQVRNARSPSGPLLQFTDERWQFFPMKRWMMLDVGALPRAWQHELWVIDVPRQIRYPQIT